MAFIICHSSCSTNADCGTLLATGQNPFIYLQLNNSQDKNLLDPATTGHYDTALIKKLNGDKIRLSSPGILPVVLMFSYYDPDIASRIISVTATDQDTLNVITTVKGQDCNIYTELNAVKYNGVTLQANNTSLYIAHK